jgi:phosphopantetheine--protein transferase-like protein
MLTDDCDVFWLDPASGDPGGDGLAPDEESRASAMRQPKARAAFVSTRRLLRRLLGARVGIAPERLVFVTNENGKPRLRDGGVHFNVAHCEGHALIALRKAGPVGVDVERVPEILPERDAMARRVLTPREQRWLRARPEPGRTRDFMRLWVVKEAFAKCLGFGLSGPLQELEAEIDDDGPRALRWLGHPERCFTATVVSLAEGVVAALVAEAISPGAPTGRFPRSP